MTSEKFEGELVIVSPHPDDEIIGCFSVLENNSDKRCNIVYTTDIENYRKEEAIKLRQYYNNIRQFFTTQQEVPPVLRLKEFTFYFPDPYTEFHPDHKFVGIEGEKMARQGFDVIFYTVQKSVPYVHLISNISKKEWLLDEVYGSQSSLWQYEKKYILFEGYQKWLF